MASKSPSNRVPASWPNDPVRSTRECVFGRDVKAMVLRQRRNRRLSAEKTPVKSPSIQASSTSATSSASLLHRRLFLPDMFLDKDDNLYLTEGLESTVTLAAPPAQTSGASSCTVEAASATQPAEVSFNAESSPDDNFIKVLASSPQMHADLSNENAQGIREDTSVATNTQDICMDHHSSQLDWHMEILCCLFLRSDEKEVDWLEEEVKKSQGCHKSPRYQSKVHTDLSTLKGGNRNVGNSNSFQDMTVNGSTSSETKVAQHQLHDHSPHSAGSEFESSYELEENKKSRAKPQDIKVGNINVTPRLQPLQHSRPQPQVHPQQLSQLHHHLITHKKLACSNPDAGINVRIVCEPTQQQVNPSIIHNNADIERKGKYVKFANPSKPPSDEVQQCPKMEMELPSVEHSLDPTVFSLIPATLRSYLNLTPEQVLIEKEVTICPESVVKLNTKMRVKEPVVDLTLENNDDGNSVSTESNLLHRSRIESPSKLSNDPMSLNNDSDDNTASDYFERHYFTRSAEKAAEEKKIDSSDQNLLLLLDKPFAIPSTWKKPDYAALSLSQWEDHIKNSIERQGGSMQDILGGENKHESSWERVNGSGDCFADDEQIDKDLTNGISSDNHHTQQQVWTSNNNEVNETDSNEQQYADKHNLVSILYNECSMTTFANWAMMDFLTNIKEPPLSREDIALQNSGTNKTKRFGEHYMHQQVPQNFQSADWTRYKKEQSKALSMDTTRFNLPVTYSSFRLCGMCGKFGHYELECDTLLSANDPDLEKNPEFDAETTEIGSEYNSQRRKRKLSDTSTYLDNESKKKISTFLANEIRIQKTVQDLLSDLDDEQITTTVNKENLDNSNCEGKCTASVLDGLEIGGSKDRNERLHLQESRKEDLGVSDREHSSIPQSIVPNLNPAESLVEEDVGEEDDSTDPYVSKSSCCKICRSGFKGDEMLLCDGCDELFHFKCLDPPLDSVPEGDWFCSNCESYDSDISSVVELEGCEGFVVEQRKRADAKKANYFAGVSLGKGKSPWTAALSLLSEGESIVDDQTYIQGHLDRQYNDISPMIPGEICWGKRFDDQLGREDWWPAMVMKHTNKRASKQSVQFFALNQKAAISSSKLLPFIPYYEDIGHKRLVRCNTAGHELFRHAVSLCVSTLGLKSASQLLKLARNGIQKTLGMSENISSLSEKLRSSGWKPPAGWEHASFDEIDGVIILSKQDSSQVSNSVEASNFNDGDIEKTSIDDVQTRLQDFSRNPFDAINSHTNDHVEMPCNLNEFSCNEIIGGLVSWRPLSRSVNPSGGSDEDQYGVIMSINGAKESALIRALPALSQVSSGNFDAVFREGNDLSSTFIHAHDLGATIWMPLSSLRFVSSKACSSDICHFRKTLRIAMENEMKSFSSQCRRAAVNREEHMVELRARESLDITSPIEAIWQGPRGGERRGPILRTDSGGEVFHVEAIIDERSSASSEKQYLIKWKGFDGRHNTWEPARNIYSEDVLQRYKGNKLLERLRQTPEASDPSTLTHKIFEAIRVGVEKLSAGDAETTDRIRATVFCPWCKFESLHGRALTNHMKKHKSMRNYDLIRDCIKTCDVSWFDSLRR